VKGFRDDGVMATEFGFRPDWTLASPAEHIRRVAENGLRYPGVDPLDVFRQHRVDPNLPIEGVAGAFEELIEAGAVRWFGMPEAGPDTLRRAHVVQPVAVLQTGHSLFARTVDQLFPTLEELGTGFVAWSPQGRGFLTARRNPWPNTTSA
jgi:aryl-alcohol dehydrogenase-like predicted oxidoreductase